MFVICPLYNGLYSPTLSDWLEYGCAFYKDGRSAFAWRFPIAFQILPLLGLIAIVWFFPESPRWLAKVGRDDEARYILGRLRGEEDGVAQSEFEEVQAAVSVEKDLAAQQSYVRMFFGIGDKKLHVARRVQLVIWLQIIQEWVGIAGVTVYAPTIFRIAGIGNKDSQWISGLNNVTYMVSIRFNSKAMDRC
jgi:MFS family permease